MSSESEEDSREEERHHSRLTNIWKSIQQTKNISQTLDHRQHATTPSHHDYKQNLAHLLAKVQGLQQQNGELRVQLRRLREGRQEELASVRRDLESKLRSQARKAKNSEKENVVQNEGGRVEALSREIDRLNLKIRSLEMDNRSKQSECVKLTEMNEKYLQRIDTDHSQLRTNGKGERLLELDEAQLTIQRLVELLRRTEEYREFGGLLQDAKNLHYLRNVLKRLKANQLMLKPIDRKQCSCQAKLSQKLLWSPTHCYKTMLQLKLKYDYLNEDCIEQVLFEMNRIYGGRQQRALAKQKQCYQLQLCKLRKQMELGYDDFLAKKQINRLKKELRVVRSAQKARPRLDQLKDRGVLSDQLKLKEKEIRLLRERIRLFESENGFNDKTLYYQGTIWALQRVLGELQGNECALKQFQMRFRERLQQNLQPQDWLRSYKQFFQSLQELGGGLAQRVLGLKQGALRKMGRAE